MKVIHMLWFTADSGPSGQEEAQIVYALQLGQNYLIASRFGFPIRRFYAHVSPRFTLLKHKVWEREERI